MEKTKKETKKEKVKPVGALSNGKCDDPSCHLHGDLRVRGRTFKGEVTRKFPRRVTIEFERMIYIRKYERYARARTKVHARLPKCMEENVKVGDLITVQECRPLSKIIHFAVVGKIRDADVKEVKGK